MTDFDRISEADRGLFLVTTHSASRYVLDLEARSVTRHRGVGLGVSELRNDGDAVRLCTLIRCTVGRPMVLLIAVADDPATLTTRTTAEVESIETDVLVLGDVREATDLVQALVDRIAGMRGIYGGRLRNAGQVEALTANLVSINRRYKAHAGLRVTDV